MNDDKYKNALAHARQAYGSGAYDDATLEAIFPELKESEDERMIGVLQRIVERYAKGYDMVEAGVPKASVLAWLEKQKEQNPEWSEADEVYLEDALWCVEKAEKSCKNENDKGACWSAKRWLKSLRPQQKQEWSEDWREEDIQTRFAFYTYKDDPSVLYLSNVFVEESSRNHGFGTRILRAAEKVAETIGTTTISLKVKQDSPANAWYRKNGYGYVAFEDGYDWLEKNLEYMKPNKQEWSANDKAIVNCIVCCLDGQFVPEAARKQSLEWFNKHRRDFLNNTFWKPSEEQMEALLMAIEGKCPSPTSYLSRRLEELYDGLANTYGVKGKEDKK